MSDNSRIRRAHRGRAAPVANELWAVAHSPEGRSSQPGEWDPLLPSELNAADGPSRAWEQADSKHGQACCGWRSTIQAVVKIFTSAWQTNDCEARSGQM